MLSASWVTDFLSNGSQSVRVRDVNSEESALHFGVPQGSVLGPRISNQYAEDVSKLFNIISYATICLLTTCSVTAAEDLLKFPQSMVSRLERCATDVSIWCASRRLQLNVSK